MAMARTWEGLTLKDRIHRAAGRAIVGIGVAAVVETKRVTHVQFGTLRRSVHVAEPGYVGDGDEQFAKTTDLQGAMSSASMINIAKDNGSGPTIEMGSWLPYACAEWIGRGHPGVNEGLEQVRGFRADNIVRTAFKEEGL